MQQNTFFLLGIMHKCLKAGSQKLVITLSEFCHSYSTSCQCFSSYSFFFLLLRVSSFLSLHSVYNSEYLMEYVKQSQSDDFNNSFRKVKQMNAGILKINYGTNNLLKS